jgi:plasmid stabilization system protein ParE
MVTVWTPEASAELRKAYDYISKDSPQNARKVVDEITRITDELPAQPEMFPPDKF